MSYSVIKKLLRRANRRASDGALTEADWLVRQAVSAGATRADLDHLLTPATLAALRAHSRS